MILYRFLFGFWLCILCVLWYWYKRFGWSSQLDWGKGGEWLRLRRKARRSWTSASKTQDFLHILLPCRVCKKRCVFSPLPREGNIFWLVLFFLMLVLFWLQCGRIAHRFGRLDVFGCRSLRPSCFLETEQSFTILSPVWRPLCQLFCGVFYNWL